MIVVLEVENGVGCRVSICFDTGISGLYYLGNENKGLEEENGSRFIRWWFKNCWKFLGRRYETCLLGRRRVVRV